MASQSTKDQLITAAIRLLDTGGPEAVTLRAVAQEVGVSHNAPYKHFTDKRALLSAVAQKSFADMNAAFAELSQQGQTPLASLRLIVARYLEFAENHPARYRLLFSDPDIGKETGDVEAHALRTFDAVSKLLKAAQRTGEIRKEDPAKLTALLYGGIHGLADLKLSGRARSAKGMDDIGALSDLLLDVLSK